MRKICRFIQELVLLNVIMSFFVACPVIISKSETVTVTYVTSHGTKPADKTVEKDSFLTAAELPELSEEGWTFKYWKDSTGTKAEAGKYKAEADVTLTAVWEEVIPPEPEPETVTITYVTTHGIKPSDKTVEKDSFLTAAELPELSEEGWTFKYWKDAAGTKAEAGKYKAEADVTLTAVWEEVIPPEPEPETVTVSYVTSHGTKPADKTVEKDSFLTAAELPELSEEGWTFKYWKDSTGTKAEAGKYKAEADVTLTAVWEEVIPPEPEPEEEDFTVTVTLNITDIEITESENEGIVTLTASEGYTDYEWIFADEVISTTRNVEYDMSQCGSGVYTFILTAKKNNLTYFATAVIVKEAAND